MTAITRTTHTVRCKSANGAFFADVEILDAISFELPNGYEICYRFATADAVFGPNIVDHTGDNCIAQTNAIRESQGVNSFVGQRSVGPQSTRVTHMLRLTSFSNSSAFLDVEVCDAFTMIGPEHTDFCIRCPTNPPAVLDAAITDNTGSGLAAPANALSTRAQHVAKLTRQISGGQQTDTDYLLTLLWDAVVFSGPSTTEGMPWFWFRDPLGDISINPVVGSWGDKHVLKLPNLGQLVKGVLNLATNTIDKTKYVTDPQTGEQVPPDNADPHVYVYFPPDSQSPFLGASPYVAQGLGNVPAVDMGPLWWIRKVGSTSNVWFWFVNPIQQPKKWSFFGIPPQSVNPKWGYRGFCLLPFTSVIWILSENYPLVPLGETGATSLEVAAGGYFTPDPNGQFNPNGPGGGYDLVLGWAGVGLTPNASTIGTSTTLSLTGGFLGAGLPFLNFTLASFYMPFGAFDLTAPTSEEIGPPNSFGGPAPNIWQVTGLEQPGLVNPGLPWDATKNPHKPPSIDQAKEVVEKFRDLYNACANAYNDAIAGYTGGTYPGFGDAADPPPGWDFETPFGGQTVATAQAFSGPIPVGVALPYTFSPATCYTIEVGQLDPSVWNVQPVIDHGDPPVKFAET